MRLRKSAYERWGDTANGDDSAKPRDEHSAKCMTELAMRSRRILPAMFQKSVAAASFAKRRFFADDRVAARSQAEHVRDRSAGD